jgi:hypothetical protein
MARGLPSARDFATLAMLQKLLQSCAFLWILGIAGMWGARVLVASELSERPFRIAAGLWILGGIGFTCFAVLGLLHGAAQSRSPSEREHAPEGDLSLFLRRR